MKIFIGNHPTYVGTYQIARLLEYVGVSDKKIRQIGGILKESFVGTFLQWFHTKFCQQKVKIQIDPWDTWNVDTTMGMIMYPLFIQLKENKNGSGFVDDSDVPDELKSTSAPASLTTEEWECGHTDANWHKRYNWVIDEVIWALRQSTNDTTPEYTSGDMSPWKLHQKRLDNSFRLMGKYWQSFWT